MPHATVAIYFTFAISSRSFYTDAHPIMIKPSYLISLAFIALSSQCNASEPPMVAIDVGHSKLHPGAISARGKPEFEFNVELARVIQQSLTIRHVQNFLIGGDGSATELQSRTPAASASGATFFFSVHHDSTQLQYLDTWEWQGVKRRFSDRFSGFSLFISRKNPQVEASLNCARMIGVALKQAGLSPSSHHAEPISGENREWADQDVGVYYFDDLVVLKTAKTPAILFEVV